MIPVKFLIFLAIGTICMLVPLMICATWYGIRKYKSVFAALLLTVVGTMGTYLLGWIESYPRFGSRSFYGAVFLIPVDFFAIAKLLRISYGALMDMSAPSVCVMLVLMKALCCIEGCCDGRVLYTAASGAPVVFPSQIVELVNALALFGVLMRMIHRKKYNGEIYAWFFVLYGVSRFALNFFRADLSPFAWILPAGHFWSVCAIATGAVTLFIYRKKLKKEEQEIVDVQTVSTT